MTSQSPPAHAPALGSPASCSAAGSGSWVESSG
jgi:hypothetical protein